MKRIYNKPVLEVESFVTEEIMENFNPENVLSYGAAATDAGYSESGNFISFQDVNGNNGQVLNSIDYNDFNPTP